MSSSQASVHAGPLRIGLIGYGRIARDVHAPVLQRLPGARLTAVAEPDPQARAAARGLGRGVSAHADYLELLQGEVDAVVVCSPTPTHAACALAALRAAKHVYLEKPLADSLEDGRALVAAREQSGVVGMIGFNYRFNPVFAALRDALRTGAAGAVALVRTSFCTPRRPAPEWRRGRAGGVLLDLASHHVDLVQWLFETRVHEVAALVASRFAEHDTAVIQARLANGVLASATFTSAGLDEDAIEVIGDAGRLRANRYSGRLEVTPVNSSFGHELAALPSALIGRARRWLARGAEPSYASALGHFVSSIRAGAPAGPTFDDGLRSLKVVIAAERSISDGRPIQIDDV